MYSNTRFSQEVPVFHGRTLPEPGKVVGYGAIIHACHLPVPLPSQIVMVSEKYKVYQTSQWKIYTPRYQPGETLYNQLVFALKYEGVNLLVLKKLFQSLTEKEVIQLVTQERTGQYSRRLWFLYEWIFQNRLPLPDLKIKNYVNVLDEKIQYGLKGGAVKSPRHRIINNLPGVVDFCPLIFKTQKLEHYLEKNLALKKEELIKGIRRDILQRASAFLLLKDSKASFAIEGESPKSKRAARWGQTIGQAGLKPLSHKEFERLQQLIIENPRFVEMGYRQKGGFVGEHDRTTGEPVPDHISARHQDIGMLMEALIQTDQLLQENDFDAVFTATIIAFGFVFIHPFEDGNGRIHRYLIHHVLSKKQFSKQGIIFPVSAAILNHIDDYRKVLEGYSTPLLDFIEWRELPDHNVEVLNETADYYRYFDATKHAEFLYDQVEDTLDNIIPEEVAYLIKYEEFKDYIDNSFEMPDKMLALIVRLSGAEQWDII